MVLAWFEHLQTIALGLLPIRRTGSESQYFCR
jgi:hypothetical protein